MQTPLPTSEERILFANEARRLGYKVGYFDPNYPEHAARQTLTLIALAKPRKATNGAKVCPVAVPLGLTIAPGTQPMANMGKKVEREWLEMRATTSVYDFSAPRSVWDFLTLGFVKRGRVAKRLERNIDLFEHGRGDSAERRMLERQLRVMPKS